MIPIPRRKEDIIIGKKSVSKCRWQVLVAKVKGRSMPERVTTDLDDSARVVIACWMVEEERRRRKKKNTRKRRRGRASQ